MKGKTLQERRTSSTSCTRKQGRTFMEGWQERQSTVQVKMAQMLVSMSKCPDSGVVDVLDQEHKAVIGLINGFKKKILGYVTTV